MSTSPTTTPIVINGITINFPLTGSSPAWSQAIIQAIELIAQALNISAGPFDVPPQNYVMTSNVNTNVPIPNLSFPVSTVQGAIIFYGISRTSSGVGGQQLSQSGLLIINYDPSQSSGNLWQITDEFASVNGTGVTFGVTDVGQVTFSSTSITGSSPAGNINFRALAVLNG